MSQGMLTATVNGTKYTYSTSPGLPYAEFAPNTIPGSVNTTFVLGSGSQLMWLNDAFYNGQASFCSVGLCS